MAERQSTQREAYTLNSDPRRFRFALVCFNCDFRCNTLRDMSRHLKMQCPYGVPYNILCGHCEMRTRNWPRLAHHLNKPGIHSAPPKHPWLAFDEPATTVPPKPQRPRPVSVVAPRETQVPLHDYRDFQSLDPPSDVEPDYDPPTMDTPPPPKTPLCGAELFHKHSVDTVVPPTGVIRMLTTSPTTIMPSTPVKTTISPSPTFSAGPPVSATAVGHSHEYSQSPIPCAQKLPEICEEGDAESPPSMPLTLGDDVISWQLRDSPQQPSAAATLATSKIPEGTPTKCDTECPPSMPLTLDDAISRQLCDTRRQPSAAATPATAKTPEGIPTKSIKIEPEEAVVLSSDSGAEAPTTVVVKKEPERSRARRKEKDRLRLIVHLSETMHQVAAKQPVTNRMRQERAQFADRGLWPPGLAYDAPPDQISLRLGDFFRGKISALEDD